MDREKLFRSVLGWGTCAVLGTHLAGGCAESEGDFITVPYRTVGPSRDASALNEAPDPNDAPPALPPPAAPPPGAPPPNTCAIEFCPTGFGTPCCTPDGQCGIDLLGICLPPLPDAGAGGAGAGGAPGMPPPPPPAQIDCRNDADCSAGQVCCGNAALTALTCAASCGSSAPPAAGDAGSGDGGGAAPTDAGAGGIPISCSGPSDCPSAQTCCGARTAVDTYTGLTCRDSCAGNLDIVVCASDTECPTGTTCQASNYLPSGFTVCY